MGATCHLGLPRLRKCAHARSTCASRAAADKNGGTSPSAAAAELGATSAAAVATVMLFCNDNVCAGFCVRKKAIQAVFAAARDRDKCGSAMNEPRRYICSQVGYQQYLAPLLFLTTAQPQNPEHRGSTEPCGLATASMKPPRHCHNRHRPSRLA